MSSKKRVTAIYENKAQAMLAMRNLETMGYGKDDMTLLVSENSWKTDKNIDIEENSKAPEGVAIGGATGGVIGAVAAGLTTVGAVAATGGVGLLAAGPLVAALTGAGAGSAVGGIVGGLVGLGYPETEAKYVDEELGKGAVMLGVETDSDRADRVEETLKKVDHKKVSVA